jgi:hypothetical protein
MHTTHRRCLRALLVLVGALTNGLPNGFQPLPAGQTGRLSAGDKWVRQTGSLNLPLREGKKSSRGDLLDIEHILTIAK